jgi:hypothetical protein
MEVIPAGCLPPVLPLFTKKAVVAEYPKIFDHAGLLVNGPPGTIGLPFI